VSDAKLGEMESPLLRASPVRLETDDLVTVTVTFIVAAEATVSVAVIVAV
jgi:hypothetical protein